MICGSGKVRTDGKRWWRHKASHGRHQPKNWKVMLWLMAALLALAEDVLSEDDGPENQLDPHRRVLGRPSWRPPVPETQDHVAPLWPEAFETWRLLQDVDAAQSRWRRSPRDVKPSTSRKKPKRPNGGSQCRMEKRQTRVRELGLGYDSDEIVLFKYCVGSCRAGRRNYDLALGALVARGGVSARKVSGHPCCRPTRYEAVSFMDARAMWQTIRWLSAAECGCVG
ncbi:glial cell line-derived neurotrophic factor [Vanacampus margaritifer]